MIKKPTKPEYVIAAIILILGSIWAYNIHSETEEIKAAANSNEAKQIQPAEVEQPKQKSPLLEAMKKASPASSTEELRSQIDQVIQETAKAEEEKCKATPDPEACIIKIRKQLGLQN
ncbi:hypothetical protein X805_04710 [Sphaerotilus natans subsp. natans DSM 6575]|uniref:Uncharacterized protein n=2 Tax=Sphaerotilus natans TaxID=34103 RepID=A0A059KR04_9BURK|nr:hypothetical protein X805_04710 [Sphaerotilus natans subsp. natans DSM 6575]